MQPEDSLSCSEQPATGLHPKPYESTPHTPSYFYKIHFYITFPSTFRSEYNYICEVLEVVQLTEHTSKFAIR
jgi:hypothetical protein